MITKADLSYLTPGGAQTLSKMSCRYPPNYPKLLQGGKGGRVKDGKGHEFIDLIAGLGAVGVGYCNPALNEAAERQMRRGVSFSLPTETEYLAAKKLTELVPWTEMWKFGKNGTDGTVMAVRAARAYTGRDHIVTVGYNGCADVFEIKGTRNAGIPKSLENYIHKAKYNDLESFQQGPLPACILLEPMVFEYPRYNFLIRLREYCTANGIILIFDEVVTGGRFEQFTASRYFGVVPDLIVLGKAISGGFPLCAVGGTRHFMEVFERNDFFASSTFGGEAVSLAVFLETADILVKTEARRIVNGRRIKASFNEAFSGTTAICEGYPTRLNFKFPSDAHKYLFWQDMCSLGVLVGYTNFIMSDHTEADVFHIVNSIKDSAQVLKQFWSAPEAAFKGALPTPALRN